MPHLFPLLSALLSVLFVHSFTHPAYSDEQLAVFFWYLSTQCSLLSVVLLHLSKYFSSVPLILFARKQLLRLKVQFYCIVATQISHFVLFHCATQFPDNSLFFLRGRASQLRAATPFRAFFATIASFPFHCSKVRALASTRTSPHIL